MRQAKLIEEWIEVKDGLPEDGQIVLCFIPENNCFTNSGKPETRVDKLVLRFEAHYYNDHNVRCSNNGDSDAVWNVPAGPGMYWFHDVTHWMPLPDSPLDEMAGFLRRDRILWERCNESAD